MGLTGPSWLFPMSGKTGAGEGIRTLDPNLGKKLQQLRQNFFFYAKARKSKLLLTSAYDILSSTYPAKR
ncbi:hypothetical protein [uncultured Sphingopyxis sp.]|uniref:hypothetical protein n=1 Tax=uncultured Sphingopyxis sp. TaxID=310581 RepID=UPI000AFDB863|nr:hypothetical protein [uncultured Sphingopyxis sp.]